MKSQIKGISAGKFDKKNSSIEINGVLYELNGHKEHRQYVEECVGVGILEEYRINLMKYENKKVVEI